MRSQVEREILLLAGIEKLRRIKESIWQLMWHSTEFKDWQYFERPLHLVKGLLGDLIREYEAIKGIEIVLSGHLFDRETVDKLFAVVDINAIDTENNHPFYLDETLKGDEFYLAKDGSLWLGPEHYAKFNAHVARRHS